MPIDLNTELWIVAQEGVREIQYIIMCLCIAALGVCVLAFLFHKFGEVFHKVYKDWLHLDGIGRIGAVIAIAVMTMYGGAKHKTNIGADDGITLAYIDAVTNAVGNTELDIAYTAGAVTTSTPIHVRNIQTDEWTRLQPIASTIYADSLTNHVYATVASNQTEWVYWWIGSNPPSVIIEVVGITLTSFIASAHSVEIQWTCDDPEATVFEIEYKNSGDANWTKLMETEDTFVHISGFFVNRTTQWRVKSTVEGDN